MVVLQESGINHVGEIQSMHPGSNRLIMIADCPSPALPTDNDVTVIAKSEKNNNMAAQAHLLCRPNSHPFQERKLSLDQPVKIGRSVVRLRPLPTNAIFDCKVLSRNHALLWYENGKFYLQDTKSSNGTFVNNQRLSKGSEESSAREVCSGDIVQFGVDVMENSRKVTHGCIVATLKLFLPDGKEAKASPTTSVISSALVNTQELYQLAHCLQEAVHREQQLENKLATLQKLISNTQDSSDSSWKALIDEDRLLTRLELLENQLQAYSKNFTEDKLREEIMMLQNDKDTYQNSAKESLRKVLQDKLDAVRKHQELEASLVNAEDECAHLRKVCDRMQNELDLLAEKNANQLKDMAELIRKLEEADDNVKEASDKSEQEKQELERKIEDMLKEKNNMSAKLECLQADNDFTKEQLSSIRARIDSFKKGEAIEQNKNEINDYKTLTKGIQVEKIIDKIEDDSTSDGFLNSTEEELQNLRRQIMSSETELEESKLKVKELQDSLQQALKKSKQGISLVSTLEERLEKSRCQKDASDQLSTQLQVQMSQLEDDLLKVKSENMKNVDDDDNNVCGNGDNVDGLKIMQDSHQNANDVINNFGNLKSDQYSALQTEIAKLKELLNETRINKQTVEDEVQRLKTELDNAHLSAKNADEEIKSIQEQLTLKEQQIESKSQNVSNLQEQLVRSETSAKEVKQQISTLKSKLSQEEDLRKTKQRYIDTLLVKLEEEKQSLQNVNSSLKQVNLELHEAQQSSKQTHNEAELLRGKLKLLQEELLNLSDKNSQEQDTNRTSDENSALKDECSILKVQLKNLGDQAKIVECEREQLENDYKRLHEEYVEMALQKEQMENLGQGYWKEQFEQINNDFDLCHLQLSDTRVELLSIKKSYVRCQDEKTECERNMNSMKERIEILNYQSNMVSVCAIIPLIILMVAIITAFLPTWSSITATQDKPGVT